MKNLPPLYQHCIEYRRQIVLQGTEVKVESTKAQ